MNKPKICGIYKITNKINGKSYIGQSEDIYKRWGEHLSHAKNKDINFMITNAISKYGADSFIWEILEECSPSMLDEKEKYYIQTYNTYVGCKNANGYNMTTGGDGYRGGFIMVDKYNKNGEFLCTYQSITDAADDCSVHKTQIVQCCKRNPKYRSAGGFLWRYHGDEPPEKYTYRDVKKLARCSVNGDILEIYSSGDDASEQYGVSYGYLMSCCRINAPTFMNYIWKIVE